MGFWDAATEGANRGIGIGIQSYENSRREKLDRERFDEEKRKTALKEESAKAMIRGMMVKDTPELLWPAVGDYWNNNVAQEGREIANMQYVPEKKGYIRSYQNQEIPSDFVPQEAVANAFMMGLTEETINHAQKLMQEGYHKKAMADFNIGQEKSLAKAR